MLFAIIGIHLYVNTHKKEMLTKIEQQFERNFYGSISVVDIQADFWKKFPSVCLVLKEVVIRDTNWDKHHHDFLQAQNIYVQIENLAILGGKVRIKNITLSNGGIYFFEDASYNSNKSIFEKKRPAEKKRPQVMKGITLDNIDLHYIHFHRKKDFHCSISHLETSISSTQSMLLFKSKGAVFIKACCFNTDKGSYLKQEKVALDLAYNYDLRKQQLCFTKQQIALHKNLLQFDALFFLQENADSFRLNVSTVQLNYATAIGLLAPNIHKRLDSFKLDGYMAVQINIAGKLKHQAKPWIQIEGQVRNNTLRTHYFQFDHCAFAIHYQNGTAQDSIPSEEKAKLVLRKVAAHFKDVPITADSAIISNLKTPYIQTRIRSHFNAILLNQLISKKSFVIQKGTALIDLDVAMGLKWSDRRSKMIKGSIRLNNLDFSYLPRQIQFKNSQLFLTLDSEKAALQESSLNTAKSQIKVAAIAPFFTKYYVNNPDLIRIDASIKSAHIDFNEFQHFLHKRVANTAPKAERIHSFADDIDKAFDASSTHINIEVQSLVYKQFQAKQVQATILLAPQGITLSKMRLEHSEGQSTLYGYIKEVDNNYSEFHIYSKLQKASIAALLNSFNNFGQKTFTPENTQGIICMDNDIKGRLDTNGHLIRSSVMGTCRFVIDQGNLINFTPLEKMGRIVFKKKRLSNVHFGQLKNNISIKGQQLFIPAMFIKTDLMSMQIQGIFNLDKGTDLQIEVPLFKEDAVQLNNHPGIDDGYNFRLRLNAKDDEQGNLMWQWHISNKAIADARADAKKARALRKKPHSK
jgi:hypothetical protein